MPNKHKFYPLFALLFGLLLTLAFTGPANAEVTVTDCGDSVETSTTITVTDDNEFGLTRFVATDPADLSVCGEPVDPHWSKTFCGDDGWHGWLDVPTSCNTITVSDTQVTQVSWVDESVMWDVSGQELVRATVTETVPPPTPTYEVWDEDSGRDIHVWTSGITTTVFLDSVGYNNWKWVEERQKSQLIIPQRPFGASFNTGDASVVWEIYSYFWRVSPENTVDRIMRSPSKMELWIEDSGRDLIIINIDGATPDLLDHNGFTVNGWQQFDGTGKTVLRLLDKPFAQLLVSTEWVLWENYAQEYWAVGGDAINRIKASPTRIQVFSENAGADVFLFNLDQAAFDVYFDQEVLPYWTWTWFGEEKLWLRILGRNNGLMFNLGNIPVIWEDYSQDWDVDATNNVVRVNPPDPPAPAFNVHLPAVMR